MLRWLSLFAILKSWLPIFPDWKNRHDEMLKSKLNIIQRSTGILKLAVYHLIECLLIFIIPYCVHMGVIKILIQNENTFNAKTFKSATANVMIFTNSVVVVLIDCVVTIWFLKKKLNFHLLRNELKNIRKLAKPSKAVRKPDGLCKDIRKPDGLCKDVRKPDGLCKNVRKLGEPRKDVGKLGEFSKYVRKLDRLSKDVRKQGGPSKDVRKLGGSSKDVTKLCGFYKDVRKSIRKEKNIQIVMSIIAIFGNGIILFYKTTIMKSIQRIHLAIITLNYILTDILIISYCRSSANASSNLYCRINTRLTKITKTAQCKSEKINDFQQTLNFRQLYLDNFFFQIMQIHKYQIKFNKLFQIPVCMLIIKSCVGLSCSFLFLSEECIRTTDFATFAFNSVLYPALLVGLCTASDSLWTQVTVSLWAPDGALHGPELSMYAGNCITWGS